MGLARPFLSLPGIRLHNAGSACSLNEKENWRGWRQVSHSPTPLSGYFLQASPTSPSASAATTTSPRHSSAAKPVHGPWRDNTPGRCLYQGRFGVLCLYWLPAYSPHSRSGSTPSKPPPCHRALAGWPCFIQSWHCATLYLSCGTIITHMGEIIYFWWKRHLLMRAPRYFPFADFGRDKLHEIPFRVTVIALDRDGSQSW